jgi:serine/threonine protein kinase
MVGGLGPSVREGEVLAAKYRLERELGRGSMGTVWAATHLTLQQRVAIKFIAAEFANSLEARLRFRTEARAAAHLKSRYVVQVYDDGETMEGTPYIVMQYLEGETLEQRLEREGAIPLLDAVRVTGHVARALRRAHARGIVHRDLKPANIYLCRNDEDEHGWIAKVLDFGVAKTEGLGERATTKPGAMLGTPLFMSPEQVQRASLVDHRADLYSLGMCFFNMVTGRYAFEEQSFAAVLVAICSHPLPNLGLLSPTLPPAVVAWFDRCCARDPDARFQSADEAFVALREAAGSVGPAGASAGAHDETLRGHRAPLSHRAPPLGTADSASYPGTDASHRVTAGRGAAVWIALSVALGGLTVLGVVAVFALSRLVAPDNGTRSAALTEAPAAPLMNSAPPLVAAPPPAPTPAPAPSPSPAISNARSELLTRNTPEAARRPAKPALSTPNRGQKPAPPRRTPTDLGF